MIGRGAVADPALFRELSGGPPLSSEELSVFLDRLTARWLADGLGPAFTLERMKALWFYMKDLFPDAKSQIKAILKAKSLEEYRPAVSSLLCSIPAGPAKSCPAGMSVCSVLILLPPDIRCRAGDRAPHPLRWPGSGPPAG